MRFVALLTAVVLGLVTLQGDVRGGSALTWGDVDCQDGVTTRDNQALLRAVLIQAPLSQAEGCPDIGAVVNVDVIGPLLWGDADCDGEVNSRDSQATLRNVLGQNPLSQTPPCPGIGDPTQATLGVGVDGNLVTVIGGETLDVHKGTGADMLEADASWSDYLSELGLTPDDVSAASAAPSAGSDLDFRMISIEAIGVDWSGPLAELVAGMQVHPESGYVAEEVLLGAKNVTKVTVVDDTSLPPVYYAALGRDLAMIISGDEALVALALEALPGPSAAAKSAMPQGSSPPPLGVNPIVLRPLFPMVRPVCVAEPFGRVRIELMAVDGGYQVPIPVSFVSLGGALGEVTPSLSYGPVSSFLYRANSFGNQEQLTIQAIAPAGGQGIHSLQFPVQHCLNGQWQDGPRVLEVGHIFTQVTSNITSGELVCGEAGTAFTGQLDPGSDRFSGSDMKVCNPEDCVDAGLLDKTDEVEYSAAISLGGNGIDFTWTRKLFDYQYDDETGDLVACTESGTEDSSFSISRISFGPGVP